MDVAEDVRRIGVQGFAGDQFVSLYRYYKKLTTAPGQAVRYSESEVSLLNSIRLGMFVNSDVIAGILGRSRLSAELAADVGISPADGTAASVLPRGAPLIVTGHSLGGHLALLFGRFFPDVAERVYTYNAPGIGLQGELALRLLGIPPAQPSQVTNVASVMGEEAVSRVWSKPGENIGVFTETGSPLYQHSIVPLADSLALHGAFGTLSPGLAGSPATVSGIISAASPRSEDSLEVVLDALRGALGAGGAPTLIARGLSDLAARESYYQNLYALLDARDAGRDYRIESLAGKSAAELASMADSDVSVRYALNELTPFAVGNADYASFEDAFSGQWLASRAELLAAMLDGNLVERAFGFSGSVDNVIFSDVDSDLRYSKLDGIQGNLAVQISALADRSRLQQFLDAVPYNRAVIFGSDSSVPGDRLVGLSGGDRLFGAAGDDTLEGVGGDDYLEGGPGADTLRGGTGDDVLDGGEGADRLEGGAGSDSYVFSAGLDADTIVDRDGRIYAGPVLLTGGIGGQGGPYVSTDGRFSYEFHGDLASEGTLLVNGSLRVENFRNGDLGIRLATGMDPREIAPPSAEVVLRGDAEYSYQGDSEGQGFPLDEFGNPDPSARSTPAPDRPDPDDEFPGTPGNTHFILGGGNDLAQDRLGGDDWIELGSGNDAGFGGVGNDLIEGGPGRDLLAGGRGDDVVIAGTLGSFARDLEETAPSWYAEGGDLLSGGDGDDVLIGDAEANLIEGGAGSDQILGGAGDDWIGGDVAELARRERYAFADPDYTRGARNPYIDILWRYGDVPGFSLQPSEGFGTSAIAAIGNSELQVIRLDQVAGDADRIFAGAGSDTVAAGGGDDFVDGANGDDYIDTGYGADTVYGGEGNDYIVAYWDALGDYVDAGDGNDFISTGEGDDVLIGGAGNDRLASFGGSDLLIGGEGRDFLLAVGGAIFEGGPGDDMLTASSAPEAVNRFRWGRDQGRDVGVVYQGGLAVEVTGDVLPEEIAVSYLEHLDPGLLPAGYFEEGEESDAPASIALTIGNGADAFYLLEKPDHSWPADFHVEFANGTTWDYADLQSRLTASGSPGNAATFAGSGGADLIYGTAGADILSGAQGDDWLAGDAGNDAYVYAQGDGFDVIEDSGNTDALRFGTGILAQEVGVFASGGDYILAVGEGGVRLRGGRTPEGAIERIEFADGSLWSGTDLAARAEMLPDNRAPRMPATLGSVAVAPGAQVEVAMPREAISDPDRFDALSFYAISANGDPLPEWLHFDASSLKVSGTPAPADAGTHEVLLIAADTSGAAAYGSLAIVVGEENAVPQQSEAVPLPVTPLSVTPPAPATNALIAADIPAVQAVPAPSRPADGVSEVAVRVLASADSPRVGDSADPVFRDIQHRFDVLLQTGRHNLGERYAEAVREFEERRVLREETPAPPLTDEEVEAWNSAMHAWHARNPGFAEMDLGANDGTWTMGWGLPGPGDLPQSGGSGAGGLPGLANPNALPRLAGADSVPALSEGLRNLR